ncbi:hypothetical protein BD779DRAFT_171134 [Infundibulicybe gibba]|nr:hypothetical protein BD779DRAFT_171134 [Infundibulicybe gibba]
MKSFISTTIFLTGVAAYVLARPSVFPREGPAIPLPKNALSALEEMRCNVTSNAVASNCDRLFSSTFAMHYDKWHTCEYQKGSPSSKANLKAYNPVCVGPGHCCIYATRIVSADEVKIYGPKLMGCRSNQKDAVNGRIQIPGGSLCIADAGGCSGCFSE